MHSTRALFLALLLPLAACQGGEQATQEAEAPAADPAVESPSAQDAPTELADKIHVAETWASSMNEADNVDSVAFWQGTHEGETVAWIMATGKASHDLIVYDANTGETVRRVGAPGAEPGQFQRPNGVMVLGNQVFVAERDNHRVQVMSLPNFDQPLLIGAEDLRRPYGLTVFEGEAGAVEIYVTDNYETPEEEIPPPAELGERVKHFRLQADGTSELVRSFGDTEGPGVLTKVETLLADPATNRLLIADEHETVLTFKVYDLEGNFTGEQFGEGHFFHETEGLALRTCGDNGYWIATDQDPEVSLFRVFDRGGEYKGTFYGEQTGNTDGVTHTSEATSAFPKGAFFAVHDDQGVTAFDWQEIVTGVGLEGDC